ncbi:MAG: ABC transporter substrate-binding protein [Chloroflexota bacterium]
MHYVRFAPAVTALMLALAACGGSAAPASTAPAAPASSAAAKPATSAPASGAASIAAKPAGSASAKPAAAASGAAEVSTATLQQIVDGAKKEPAIKGSWSSSSFGGADGFNAMVDGINKKFGLSIKGTFTPGIDMQAMQGKIAEEAAANKPPDSDIYLGNAQGMRDALDTKSMKAYNWQSLVERPIPADAGAKFDPYAPNGTGVAIVSSITGVTYNSKLVKADQVPHKLQDLLKPEFKGKIASTPYAAGWREFSTKDLLGKDFTVNYVKQFSNQVAGLIRCGEPDRLSSGEFLMLAMDCGGQDASLSKAKGAPIDQVVLDDATTVHSFYAAVPVNSQAPNASALISLYLETPEGQNLLYKYWYGDLYTYPEAQTKAQVDKVSKSGGKYAVDSPQWLESAGDFVQNQKELQDILAKK